MRSKRFSLLLVTQDEAQRAVIERAIKADGKLILAKNWSDALAKFGNQVFEYLVIDENSLDERAWSFIEENGKYKKVRDDNTKILILKREAPETVRDYSKYKHLFTMSARFNEADFIARLNVISGKADNVKKADKAKRLIKQGEVLIAEGGTNHDMFWIISGEMTISKTNQDKEQVKIGVVQAGELVGEMSFLDNLPRSATVVASEDSEVLVISQSSFTDLFESQPRWFQSIIQTLSQRLRDANAQISSLKK